MKNNYVSYVLENYMLDGNFDAVFGDGWIDETQLAELIPVVCDYAFAEYGIDAGGKYAGEVSILFDDLKAKNVVVRHGDDYSDYWYKLRPPLKKKYLEDLHGKNPVTAKVNALGDEALRRALNKIVIEDGLRSMEEKWAEADVPKTDGSKEGQEEETDLGDQGQLRKSPDPNFFESEARKVQFVSLATDTIEQVEKSELSNSEKSQARGFLMAAKALSETPHPPVDIIWTILNRANSVAGIASFFVSLITLIALAI